MINVQRNLLISLYTPVTKKQLWTPAGHVRKKEARAGLKKKKNISVHIIYLFCNFCLKLLQVTF